ncbi:transposable element Tcb1 transposase [Trichonephila clavipes]|uniref:Transposable element Tcb1 transposase n=1 Tax=Trichonephila clavipes TaxID=2585209 RepID=A0A8X6VQS3_TRICX|nr:transposable element Tcb1 transposase [Trichonephila clavipes]
MTSRHHLTEELLWRAVERLAAGHNHIEVARWLNVSMSLIHRLWQKFLIIYSSSRRFSQVQPRTTTSADDRYLSLCERGNRTQLRQISDPPLLQAPKGWERVAINSGPKNPKDLLKKRRVRRHSVHVNMSTGRKINEELFSLWMSPRLAYRIVGEFTFVEKLELFFILEAVSVFEEADSRPHRARIVGAYLEQETIQLKQWPA